MSLEIRPLDPTRDASRCEAVIRTLPDFFGHEGGLAECFEAIRTQPGRVVCDEAGPIAFATWTERTPVTAEITWMAVRRDLRHAGIGTRLVEAVCADLQQRGYRLALAMTSAAGKDEHDPADIYAATRAFWFARGFLPLVVLDIWDTNEALLMVRPLPGAA